MEVRTQQEITRAGNPAKPQGAEGEMMLTRMNRDHYDLTGWAIGFLVFNENDRVLDIGCGGGATLRRLSEKIVSGKLTGVDYSEVSVRMSAELNKTDIQSGKMKIISASVESLPFDDNSFDKIVTVESFYFWPEPAENLKEVYRVLAEGGTFMLIADIYDNGRLDEKTIENVKEFNLFNPTKEEFKNMFENAGFSQITVHTEKDKDRICVSGMKL